MTHALDPSKVRYELDEKTFHVTLETNDVLSIVSNISLQGIANGAQKQVNISLQVTDYVCCRLVNPYLNAQNDVFKIATKVGNSNKSIGYIFPAASLQDDQEDSDNSFDEMRQAYKFYCLHYILSGYQWNEIFDQNPSVMTELIDSDSSYLIIFKPLLNDSNFDIFDFLPSLAIYGYFNFPENSKANISNLLNFRDNQSELNEVINGRFLILRESSSLNLKNCKSVFNDSSLINLLYTKLLAEAENPLYRFLILYQILEYLVEQNISDGLNRLIEQKDTYTNHKFIQELGQLKDTRGTINKLLDQTNFDQKNEITGILRSFITEFDPEYNKLAMGDCLYDIRNLLFHDYKSILNKDKDCSIVGLIIQCEFVIHHLVVSLSKSIPTKTLQTLPTIQKKIKYWPSAQVNTFSYRLKKSVF